MRAAANGHGTAARGRRNGRRRKIRGLAVAAAAIAIALPLTACSPLLSMIESGGERVEPVLPAEPGGTIAEYHAQQPVWQKCGSGIECADVYAPLDWNDPAGERITLRMVKHPAKSGSAEGSLFVNPGGPGASGADYVAENAEYVVQPKVLDAYDLIGWDPRGVGASSAVSCFDAEGLDEQIFGLGDEQGLETGSDEWLAVAAEGAREFGEACAENTGPLLEFVSTASTVEDLDMMRAIVGDPKLNYLGFSYGTYIGARYADAYPEKVGRLVLDGAIDPTVTTAEMVREQTIGFELALRAYITDCLERADCPFDGTVDDSMKVIGGLLDSVDETPLRGSDGRFLGSSTMLTAIITPLYSQANWGYLDLLFSSVSEGDPDIGLLLADTYYSREDGVYLDNSTEAFSAINCLDYPTSADPEAMRAEAAELAELAPTIGRFQGYGGVFCASWPYQGVETRTAVTGEGAAPILVVGTTGDPATPYRWAEALADQLESATLVTYQGEGHTAYGDSVCVGTVVDDYLLTGKVPERDPMCDV